MEELSTSTQQEVNLLLALLAKADNREDLNQLWNLNQPFTTKIVFEWFSNHRETAGKHGYTLDDLMQESYFAFLKAVNRFDPGKGAFITVLGNEIKWHLYRKMISGGSNLVDTENGKRQVSSNALDHSSSLNEPCVGPDGSECELEELSPLRTSLTESIRKNFTQPLKKRCPDCPKEAPQWFVNDGLMIRPSRRLEAI